MRQRRKAAIMAGSTSSAGAGLVAVALTLVPLFAEQPAPAPIALRGLVVDAESGQPLPARVYVQGKDGVWHFPRSASPQGSAVAYRKQRNDQPRSVEMHTTLSAHPFEAKLPPGEYTITVERGKEYRPLVRTVTIDKEPVTVTLRLRRWINLAERGWYSGDTHVHRGLDELPNIMLAEDLNVAFPLVYWVTEAFASPKTGTKGPLGKIDAKLIPVDATHVIYPLNTEYEIFTVKQQRHTLGAFFALNHRTVLDRGVPPVREAAEQIHREGGLIELDKHNWPWTMAVIPALKPDLYELSNNHVWRTEFGFPSFGEPAADYMKIERNKQGFTERGWIDYGFQNYYALLNCGVRVQPTAGTASGVHPVPLGFGRVYVRCPKGFSYDAWLEGLRTGRSFVTTGPMLFVQVNEHDPGRVFQQPAAEARDYRVTGDVLSEQPLARIEIVVNGAVAKTVQPTNRKTDKQAYENKLDETIRVDSSAWIAVRCFEDRPDQRIRFAHSSPVHIEVAGKPLRPRRVEVEFLIKRVEEQIARSSEVLPPAALAEYQEALRFYRKLAAEAR
jgi:hypothetical protein